VCEVSRQAFGDRIGHTRGVAGSDESKNEMWEELARQASGAEPTLGELRHYVPADILNVSFPASVRGYDRQAVDSYVKRVNRVIAELKISASPPAAVRHALEQAGQQVHGLLQSARETAEGITASARHEAEESTARAKAEAAELVVSASAEEDRVRSEAAELLANAGAEVEATVARAKAQADEIHAAATAKAENAIARSRRQADERLQQLEEELAALRDQADKEMSEIRADTEAVWGDRRALLGDLRKLASSLLDLADSAAARFPRLEPAQPEDELPEQDARDGTDSSAVTTNQSAPTSAAIGSAAVRSHEDRNNIESPSASSDA
jgi:DivIVA domain-containing protein